MNEPKRVCCAITLWEFGNPIPYDEFWGTLEEGEIIWDDPDFDPSDYDNEFYSYEIS